jgi:hypothetical protein
MEREREIERAQEGGNCERGRIERTSINGER